MARTMILPAALKYQSDVAGAIEAAKKAGAADAAQTVLLKELVATIGAFQDAMAVLDKAAAAQPHGDSLKLAVYVRDAVLAAMDGLRKWGDKLETIVSDEYWPLPAYREMLFIR